MKGDERRGESCGERGGERGMKVVAVENTRSAVQPAVVAYGEGQE